MAYDQHLADRISAVLNERRISFEAKKMMGGLCFMVDDKMAVGVMKDSLMVRIAPELCDESLRRKGVRQMEFTGTVVKGFLIVDAPTIREQKELEYWIQLYLDFNPKARSSRKSAALKPRSGKGR